MRIKTVQLKDFKRFDNLTINLGDTPNKVIVMVGPNGSGKSSVFDAFEEKLKNYKSAQRNMEPSFFSKLWYTIFQEKKSEVYNRNEAVKLTNVENKAFDKKSFYIRSPYRFTPSLKVTSITSKPDVLEDTTRPASSIDLDSRLKENYEHLLCLAWNEYQYGTKSGAETRQELLGRINDILSKIIDIKISSLGDVIGGKGQLFFEKETSRDFPYENLSSGEKEVVDIIVDLIVKTPAYNDTVFCIDEPELHINTAIQRKLLVEIEKLIPDNCQLWIATHSVGFLRAIQEELKDKSQILDFSEQDYFNGVKEIKPIRTTRKNWQRIFQTALEDITGLVAPKTIIYCEGKQQPINGEEAGLDAKVYNDIFETIHHDVLFISSGGRDVQANAGLALTILNKAFIDAHLLVLKDRDNLTDEQRNNFLSLSPNNRMLIRREIENYIFDEEVMKEYCNSSGIAFDESQYNQLVGDKTMGDTKPVQQRLQHLCQNKETIDEFKLSLARSMKPEMSVFTELSTCISI